jgi:hypothetical protein
MQAIKDAAILLALILLVATIRVTPLDEVTGLVPEAQAAAAERSGEAEPTSPMVRPSSSTGEPGLEPPNRARPWTPPPTGKVPQPCGAGQDRNSRAFVLIEVKRDRPVEAVNEYCPTESGRSRQAPAIGPTC